MTSTLKLEDYSKTTEDPRLEGLSIKNELQHLENFSYE